MKFCTKCGNQMADDMVFCQKCGTKDISVNATSSVQNGAQEMSAPIHTTSFENINAEPIKLRTSMKIWMIIFFVFTGIFAIGSTADVSMLAGVCLFGILGIMFLVLAKAPKGPVKLFSGLECFKKTNGISKGAFVGVSIFLAFFLFIGIINTFDTSTTNVNKAENNTTSTVNTKEKKEEAQTKKEPDIPAEFASECPISVSVSMYDNIIGFPELKCNIKNNTDKEISAIQLYLMPKDVYGEEADGIFAQNKLQSDTPISADGTDTVVWQMIDQSVKSGDLYVYSVYFSDGTEWGDRNAPTSKIKKYAMKMEVSY